MNVVLRYVRGNRCHSVKALPRGRVMVEEYFPGGELKKVSGADTYTQEWTYDPVWGQKATLTTYKDASTPQVTGWTYNNRGFNVAKSYPDGTGPSYSYDADGKLLTRTWARGVVATYAYDAAGRASGVSYSDETPAIAVSYDFLGRVVTITDASGTKNLTYNSNSQLENETIPHIVNLSIQYGYDAYGRQTLRQLKQNDAVHASVSLSYDSRGRTATVGNGADVLHYAYRAGRNQLETAEWKNAQNAVLNSRSYAYDSYHRLTGINLNGTLEVGYTLNDKDRRTGAEYANSGLWNFIYDDKGQVTSALGSSRSFAYAYDGIGNRTSATEGSEQFSYASNQLNQYTAVNASQPTYDADGNLLTTGTGWTYTWNGENRLISAENGDTRLEFNYDCMGRRFEKKVYIANTLTKHEKFVYDGYKLTAVYDVLENNALRMTFAWQPDSVDLDVPVSMTCDGETYYYVTDGNKNVTALLDADGVRVAKYTYNPFGRILNSEGALAEINPFRFSSEQYDDETGLVYYNYRYYSPELGRWTKRDPIEEEGGVNLYAMVENSPVNKIDLYGNISRLFTQIYMYWATRMVIGSEGGILGNIYNGATSSSPLILYDANKELVSEIKSAALFEAFSKAKLDQVFFKGGLTRKWQKYGVEKQNLATLAGGTLGKYEAPPSIWFWLNTSAWVYVQGTYEAKCDQGKFLWREAKFVYQWLDQIDGRSFAEAYQRGAFSMHDKSFGGALGGVVSATIEGMYDLVFDKMHNVDFRVEIRGLTELPDGFMDWPTYYPSKYLNNK